MVTTAVGAGDEIEFRRWGSSFNVAWVGIGLAVLAGVFSVYWLAVLMLFGAGYLFLRPLPKPYWKLVLSGDFVHLYLSKGVPLREKLGDATTLLQQGSGNKAKYRVMFQSGRVLAFDSKVENVAQLIGLIEDRTGMKFAN